MATPSHPDPTDRSQPDPPGEFTPAQLAIISRMIRDAGGSDRGPEATDRHSGYSQGPAEHPQPQPGPGTAATGM
jgi:hypothetical protein